MQSIEYCENNTVYSDVLQSILNAGNIIVGSSTTDNQLYIGIANELKHVFESIVGVKYNTKWMDLTDEEVWILFSLVGWIAKVK